MLEEIPDAYKDVRDVVGVVAAAGLARKVVELVTDDESVLETAYPWSDDKGTWLDMAIRSAGEGKIFRLSVTAKCGRSTAHQSKMRPCEGILKPSRRFEHQISPGRRSAPRRASKNRKR